MKGPTHRPQVVRRVGILGIGLDSTDGHTRISRGDDFTLFGGSEDTHKIMQLQVARFNEEVERLGKSLEDLTESEIDQILEVLGEHFDSVPSSRDDPLLPSS